jgi:hypothetical protein
MQIAAWWVVVLALAVSAPEESGSIVVRNSYWAKPGLEEAVYRHRLYASEVRREQGLAVGRVLMRLEESEGAPDVVWECEYESSEARQLDLEQLTASGAFEDVMEHMGTLIERFDRTVWRVGDPGMARAPDEGKVDQ